jgi:hypothetical protein
MDHIRYDILAQEALLGVVRKVLADVAKSGLPGDHHFKITFATTVPGVRLSDRMRAQYPEAMTIVLQHQFWDLTVREDAFEVGLSFSGVPERLAVPFEAVRAFYDPAVNFGVQFETTDEHAADAKAEPEAEQPAPTRLPAAEKTDAAPNPDPKPPLPPTSGGDGASGGGEVVRFDRFRKK